MAAQVRLPLAVDPRYGNAQQQSPDLALRFAPRGFSGTGTKRNWQGRKVLGRGAQGCGKETAPH